MEMYTLHCAIPGKTNSSLAFKGLASYEKARQLARRLIRETMSQKAYNKISYGASNFGTPRNHKPTWDSFSRNPTSVKAAGFTIVKEAA